MSASPATAHATPMPAWTPVLKPVLLLLLVATLALTLKVALDAEGEVVVLVALALALALLLVVVCAEGTADQSVGATAWKVSEVGVPVQPLSPQQAQSCDVWFHWMYVSW